MRLHWKNAESSEALLSWEPFIFIFFISSPCLLVLRGLFNCCGFVCTRVREKRVCVGSPVEAERDPHWLMILHKHQPALSFCIRHLSLLSNRETFFFSMSGLTLIQYWGLTCASVRCVCWREGIAHRHQAVSQWHILIIYARGRKWWTMKLKQCYSVDPEGRHTWPLYGVQLQ